MSAFFYIFVSALGAELRHILSEFLDSENFPWGIAAANFAACALIALIASCSWVGKDCGLILAGFAATLSTFSSLNYGLLKMLRSRRYFSALLYFSMSGLPTLVVVLAIGK